MIILLISSTTLSSLKNKTTGVSVDVDFKLYVVYRTTEPCTSKPIPYRINDYEYRNTVLCKLLGLQ